MSDTVISPIPAPAVRDQGRINPDSEDGGQLLFMNGSLNCLKLDGQWVNIVNFSCYSFIVPSSRLRKRLPKYKYR